MKHLLLISVTCLALDSCAGGWVAPWQRNKAEQTVWKWPWD